MKPGVESHAKALNRKLFHHVKQWASMQRCVEGGKQLSDWGDKPVSRGKQEVFARFLAIGEAEGEVAMLLRMEEKVDPRHF